MEWRRRRGFRAPPVPARGHGAPTRPSWQASLRKRSHFEPQILLLFVYYFFFKVIHLMLYSEGELGLFPKQKATSSQRQYEGTAAKIL